MTTAPDNLQDTPPNSLPPQAAATNGTHGSHSSVASGPEEWEHLRGSVRHQTVEVLRLILILVQDAVILLAGFLVEFAFEHWIHTEQPFFRLAVNISSAMFLLLYGVMVTVHVVHYVQEQFSSAAATLFGRWLPWGLAGAGVIAAVIAMNRPGTHGEQQATGPLRVSRAVITVPPDLTLDVRIASLVALSPDGSQLAYVASRGGGNQIYLRAIDSLEARPVPGTEGASDLYLFSRRTVAWI